MELPKRKKNRLDGYDYSAPGFYFITICSCNKENLFWASNHLINDQPIFTPAGEFTKQCIQAVSSSYPGIRVDQFNIMPNHIHLILEICQPNGVSLSIAIGQMKRRASRLSGFPLWQKGFYDHIIRTESEYQMIWRYVANNHWKWRDDCYHIPDD